MPLPVNLDACLLAVLDSTFSNTHPPMHAHTHTATCMHAHASARTHAPARNLTHQYACTRTRMHLRTHIQPLAIPQTQHQTDSPRGITGLGLDDIARFSSAGLAKPIPGGSFARTTRAQASACALRHSHTNTHTFVFTRTHKYTHKYTQTIACTHTHFMSSKPKASAHAFGLSMRNTSAHRRVHALSVFPCTRAHRQVLVLGFFI